MQRPSAVVGDEIGDIDQRVDRTQADRDEPALQPCRRGAVFHPAHQPQRESGAERGRRPEVERHLHRAWEPPVDRLDACVPELAHVGGREVARDAVDAGAVGAIGREIDLDHGIVEAGPLRVIRAHRRGIGEFDDAFMVVGDLQLEFGHQHAAALDPADLADAERHVLARDESPGRNEYALHARARIGRPAHDLHRIARAGIDHAHAQPVRVRMPFRRDHPRDAERRQHLAPVCDALDFEPDHGELVDDRRKRRVGVQVLLEPSEGEFHHSADSGSIPSPVCRRGSAAAASRV